MTDIKLPQPQEVSYKEKERAMAAYLMMFATTALGLPLPLINLVASLIYYFFIKETSRFVKFHSLQSLLSQVPVTLLNGAFVIWFIRILVYEQTHMFNQVFWGFLITLVFLNLVYIIFSLLAAFKAFGGRMYYFIFFGRIAYKEAFEKPFDMKGSTVVNRPPQ